MEPYFADQCRTLTEKIRALREPDNLCFALFASHVLYWLAKIYGTEKTQYARA